jgi:hypothetical protein
MHDKSYFALELKNSGFATSVVPGRLAGSLVLASTLPVDFAG